MVIPDGKVIGERKFVAIAQMEKILLESKDNKEAFIKMKSLSKRGNNKQEPPEKSISIRAASRKYKIPDRTIGRWVQNDIIPVLMETKNCKYIDEDRMQEVANKFKAFPGSGRITIKKALSLNSS